MLASALLLILLSVQAISTVGDEIQRLLDATDETGSAATAQNPERPSRRLTEYLLAGHDRNSPPDGIVDVHYELELVHILGIDELRQTLTALVYIDEVSQWWVGRFRAC